MHPDDEALARLNKEAEQIEAEINYEYTQDEEISILRQRIAELEASKSEQRNRNHDLRRAVADKKRDIMDVEQKIRIRREKERVEAALLKQAREFDEITANAKWRDRIMNHQLVASHFMAVAGRAICADEMGLGKTIEVISALDMVQSKKVLIVTPGEVLSGFREEIKRWARRPVVVIGRRPKAEVLNLLHMLKENEAEEYCLLINYEAWSRNKKLLSTLESMQFDTVIADEAHRIKEMSTSAYKGVEQIVKSNNTCEECAGWVVDNKCFGEMCSYPNAMPSVKNLFFLTGTPILNRPTEIFPLLHLIAPYLFPTQKQFLRLFCYQPDPYGNPSKWEFLEGGLARLADKIQGFYIRRTLADTDIKLPPQDIRIHELEMNKDDYPLQCDIYEQVQKYAQIMIDENPAMTMISQLAILTRLRQAVVWPGGIKIKVQETGEDGSPAFDFEGKPIYKELSVGDHFRESVKLDRAMEMLKEYVSEGKRVVIFSQFAEVIRELESRCRVQGIRACTYFGDTSHSDRDEIKANFNRANNEEPKWDVVIAHYKTGGEGLNFTAATRMIFTDEEWNPGKEDQARRRIQRIGQTEDTIVDILRVEDSIDTWLAALIDSKRNLVTAFNNENELYKEMRTLLLTHRKDSSDE